MSHEHMDEQLRRYYGSQQLDPAALERLKQLALLESLERETDAAESSIAVDDPDRRRFVFRAAGVAAALAAAILLPLVVSGFRAPGAGGAEALAGSIAREIALNHGKNLTVEFPAKGYAGLREQMNKLDFSLRSPGNGSGAGLRMLGGRYCSIQGQLAAQIKLEDEAGRVLTLYQTSFSDDFEGLDDQRRELDDVEIQIWREGDLLFGLAGT